MFCDSYFQKVEHVLSKTYENDHADNEDDDTGIKGCELNLLDKSA